jgi:hypothetical protein
MNEKIIIQPTRVQLCDEELQSIQKTDESGWRHGVDREEIFYRQEDETYWSVGYRVSTDGETHGLRDGDYTIFQVRPIKVEVTSYVKV